jgi:hypothetical protein
MRIAIVLVVSVVCSLAAPTRADQCQIVDADVAAWAARLLVKGASFMEYCEPCGDKRPAAPVTVSRTDVKADSGGNKQVAINGKDVDLAYIFVQTGKSTYSNVALLVGCPVQQVSSFIAPPATKQVTVKKEVPASCKRYVALIDRLGRCDKMPAGSRDSMRQAMNTLRDSWKDIASFPDDAIKAMADGCQQAAEGVDGAGKAAGCW